MTKVLYQLLFVALFTATAAHYHSVLAQVAVNEICVDNEYGIQDIDGEYSDWIELYNYSDSDINLLNWAITDDSDNLTKWKFPETNLPSHSFLLVFLSGKNYRTGTELHASFKINEGTEHCFLLDQNQQLINSVAAHELPEGLSYGRIPDGSGQFYYFTEHTAGYSNNSANAEFFGVNHYLNFSHESGFYDSEFMLAISAIQDPEIEIRFTVDGSKVNINSALYTQPILLTSPKKVYSGLSYYPISDTWSQPENGVNKIQVIRAAPFKNGIQIGAEVSHSYFIGTSFQSQYPTNIVSLFVNESDLFGNEAGIYVPGNNTSENFVQRGIQWERSALLEYFPNYSNEVTRQQIGIRIHGRSSRFSPQKTLRLHGRERYGNEHLELMHPGETQKDKHRELLLRAPEPLFSTSLFTDEYVQTVVKDLNFETQSQLPVTVFINGEYWGIHHIRERQGKHYLHEKFNIDEDAVDIIDWDRTMYVQEGNADNFNRLMSFLKTNSLSSPQNYSFIETWIDIPSFTEYIATQIFFANEDFTENNVRMWREHKPEAKWRFFFFDADATIREHWQNRLREFMSDNNSEDPVSLIFSSLLQNENYKRQFAATMINLLNTTFSPENLFRILEDFEQTHSPLVSEHIKRWHRPSSIAEWQNAISSMRNFIINRPPFLLEYINKSFPKPFILYPVPAKENLNIKFIFPIDQSDIKIEIMNMQNARVFAGYSISDSSVEIDTSGLGSGIYLVKIDLGNFSYYEKIIVTN